MQSCGGCKHFLKLRHDRFSGGLCDFHDARTSTDRGRKCKYFKRIKFYRDLEIFKYDRQKGFLTE